MLFCNYIAMECASQALQSSKGNHTFTEPQVLYNLDIPFVTAVSNPDATLHTYEVLPKF